MGQDESSVYAESKGEDLGEAVTHEHLVKVGREFDDCKANVKRMAQQLRKCNEKAQLQGAQLASLQHQLPYLQQQVAVLTKRMNEK